MVWIGYPLVWILGTAGFSLFGLGMQSMLYTILGIVSKVGFGLIIVARRPAVARSAQLAPPQMAT
jgi:bacteriorhodopsin